MKVINTNTKAWDIEKRMYGLGDITFPRAFTLSSAIYFLVGLALAYLLSMIPLYAMIPALVRYIGFAIGFVYLMNKWRIHSKTPVKFLMSYFEYKQQPKQLTKFRRVRTEKPIHFGTIRRKSD